VAPNQKNAIINTSTQNQMFRILYKGLLRKAKTFDNYPLLKAWADNPNTNRQKKWYSPQISFYDEVKTAFRKPWFGMNQEMRGLSYAMHTYKNWTEVYSLASSKILNFETYIENKVSHPQAEGPVHLINQIEPGCILIAHPRDEDSTWGQSIILILKHNNRSTVGVILNKKELSTALQVAPHISEENTESEDDGLETLDDEHELTPQPYIKEFKVLGLRPHTLQCYGGPVRGHIILHTIKNVSKSYTCQPGLNYILLTPRTKLTAKDLRPFKNHDGRHYRVFKGFSKWNPGQLTSEIERGCWFIAKCPPSILFPPHDESSLEDEVFPTSLDLRVDPNLWSKLLRLLGGEYYHFSHVLPPPPMIQARLVVELRE